MWYTNGQKFDEQKVHLIKNQTKQSNWIGIPTLDNVKCKHQATWSCWNYEKYVEGEQLI